MRHEALTNFLECVEKSVLKCKRAYVERYVEEFLSSERANLRIRIRFEKGHLLEINESIVVERNRPVSLGYRYHFQDQNGQLIFRYDNTPHFPGLSSHPHHKHLRERVVVSNKPDIEQVIQDAVDLAASEVI